MPRCAGAIISSRREKDGAGDRERTSRVTERAPQSLGVSQLLEVPGRQRAFAGRSAGTAPSTALMTTRCGGAHRFIGTNRVFGPAVAAAASLTRRTVGCTGVFFRDDRVRVGCSASGVACAKPRSPPRRDAFAARVRGTSALSSEAVPSRSPWWPARGAKGRCYSLKSSRCDDFFSSSQRRVPVARRCGVSPPDDPTGEVGGKEGGGRPMTIRRAHDHHQLQHAAPNIALILLPRGRSLSLQRLRGPSEEAWRIQVTLWRIRAKRMGDCMSMTRERASVAWPRDRRFAELAGAEAGAWPRHAMRRYAGSLVRRRVGSPRGSRLRSCATVKHAVSKKTEAGHAARL